MADVSAKDGSQEMAVGLLSMLLGLYVTPLIDTDTKTWVCFIIFTIIHLCANYKAVRCVVLEKLNRQRASILISHFLKTYDGKSGSVLTPVEVSKLETTFYLDCTKPYKIVLGTSLSTFLSAKDQTSLSLDVMNELKKEFKSRRYILTKTQNQILIALQENAYQQDYLRAYFHAQIYQNQDKIQNKHLRPMFTDGNAIHKLFDTFVQGLEAKGWNTKAVLLGTTEWRVSFKDVYS